MTETEMALMKKIGEMVRGQRLQVNPPVTQEILADRAGLHPVYISEVENGKRNLSVSSCARIANALDLKLSEFFSGIGE